MAVSEIQKETFLQHLDQIRMEVNTLKKQNRDLSRENVKLKSKIEDLEKNKQDVFSNVSESDRIAMRHQVTDLIEKIEKHLEG